MLSRDKPAARHHEEAVRVRHIASGNVVKCKLGVQHISKWTFPGTELWEVKLMNADILSLRDLMST
jgi:hypothetical protein